MRRRSTRRRSARATARRSTSACAPPRVGLRHLVEDATFVYHRGGGARSATERAERMARGLGAAARALSLLPRRQRARARRGPARRPVRRARARRSSERRPSPAPRAPPPAQPARRDRRHREAPARAARGAASTSSTSRSSTRSSRASCCARIWSRGDGRSVEHEFLLPGGPAGVTHGARRGGRGGAARPRSTCSTSTRSTSRTSSATRSRRSRCSPTSPGPVVCSVRDLYLACPNHWLLYRNQQPCGIPEDLSLCARCLPETRDLLGRVPRRVPGDGRPPRSTRSTTGCSPARARPTTSCASTSSTPSAIDDHPARRDHRPRPAAAASSTRAASSTSRCDSRSSAAGGPRRASTLVNGLADAFASTPRRDPPLRRAEGPAVARSCTSTAPYDNELLPELLHRAGIQVVLLPGPYAETFGHVMTEALVAGCR